MNNAYKAVNIIKPHNLELALDSASLAYKNYPLFNYLVGKNDDAKSIRQILSASVKASRSNIICFSVGNEMQAVALFAKPNYKGASAMLFLLFGGMKLIFKHSLQITFRLLNYEKFAMNLRKRYSDGNCWYLYSLTVHPDYQHNSLAGNVIQPMLDFFDSTGQSCYLETNKECNVPMYKHFGFKLLEESFIPNTDIVHYAMRREPNKNRGG